ncbi:Hnm1p [Dipodascopsis tothii]|uniref:Hnm1p n=1 Tax=Dipodascopsis tothii TaxID=44089 RepID=UPI0034CDEAE4
MSTIDFSEDPRTHTDQQDDTQLGELGYKAELKRSFSLLSMIGFAFAILTCWTAIGASLTSAMLNGGPAVLFWGWIGVCFFSMFVVLSMAEICSAYPVAGGQYSWVLLITNFKSWGRGLSYITGWIQLAGIVCLGSTALFQVGSFIAGITILNNDSYEVKPFHVVLYTWAFDVIFVFVNIFGNRLLHKINDVALWWSIGGFVISTVVLLAVTDSKRDASFVFTGFFAESGWSNKGMVVILGILQSAYALAAYDAPAHMSEELHNATREAPRAMVLSVIIGFFTGVVYIIALLFCLVDQEKVQGTKTGVPLLEIFYDATNSKAGASCLQMITLICQVFAGNALLTEGSRSIYAFARDGAMPFSKYLCHVHEKYDVPIYAILVAAFFEAAFTAIYFGSSTAFNTVMSIATAGLYVSYLLPIVTLVIHGRKNFTPGYYSLGKWGYLCNWVAIAFLTFTSATFFLPSSMPVTGTNMNYCSAAFGITFIFGLVSWIVTGRKNYIRSMDVAVPVTVATDKIVDESTSIDEKASH